MLLNFDNILPYMVIVIYLQPLPGKQLSRYFDQKSEAFLEERQHALCRFLQRMCVHPYFTFDKHLKVFLTAEPEVSLSGCGYVQGVAIAFASVASIASLLIPSF